MKKRTTECILAVIFALCATIAAACNKTAQVIFIVDGTEYQTVYTSGGENLVLPNAPQKENFAFDG